MLAAIMRPLLQCGLRFAKPLVATLSQCQPAPVTCALVCAQSAARPGSGRWDPRQGGHDAWKAGGKIPVAAVVVEDHGASVQYNMDGVAGAHVAKTKAAVRVHDTLRGSECGHSPAGSPFSKSDEKDSR